jgi:hypothetical protein
MTLVVNVQVMKDMFWHCEVQKVAKSEPPTSTLLVVCGFFNIWSGTMVSYQHNFAFEGVHEFEFFKIVINNYEICLQVFECQCIISSNVANCNYMNF